MAKALTKVSIILPCYNGAKWIRRTIESILVQNYRDFELIIVDDGSIDNSKGVITPFLREERIRYIYQKNQGFSGAINRGIRESKGTLIGFIGQDDLWLPDKLELQVKYFTEHQNISLVYSPYYSVDSEERIINKIKASNFHSKKKSICKLFIINYVGFETVLVKKHCFDKVGLFDQRMIACSDHDMWLRVAVYFDIGYLDIALVKKRQHGLQLSKNMEIVLKDEFLLVNKAIKYYHFLKKYERKKLASLYFTWGVMLIRNGNFKEAKPKLLKVIKYQPWQLKAIAAYLVPSLYKKIMELIVSIG